MYFISSLLKTTLSGRDIAVVTNIDVVIDCWSMESYAEVVSSNLTWIWQLYTTGVCLMSAVLQFSRHSLWGEKCAESALFLFVTAKKR